MSARNAHIWENMTPLCFERGLIAKCVLANNAKETIKTATLLSATSKSFYQFIHSELFFKALVCEMDPGHPYFNSEHEMKETGLKNKFKELRGCCSCKIERFRGVPYAEPWITKNGVELISFKNGIESYLLNENSKTILAESSVFPKLDQSERYFAISDGSHIHLYTANRDHHLASYEVEGEICQVALHEQLLSVVMRDVDEVCYIVTFDLEDDGGEPFNVILPGDYLVPICFGKTYLIYLETLLGLEKSYILPLSCLYERIEEYSWRRDIETEGDSFSFSVKDHFIEVHITDADVCINRLSISEDYIERTSIIKDVVIPKDPEDVYFHNNRLFLSYEISGGGTKLYSYDIKLGRMAELMTVSTSDFSCFLSAEEKVHYIAMKKKPIGVSSQLATLTYGKI